MTITATQLADLRRMVNEPTTATYTDAILNAIAGKYPMVDIFGEQSVYYTGSNPPVATANDEWFPTYDLNAAAADVWDEKASAVSVNYDFTADGGDYKRSQQFEMYSKMARTYRSRRSLKTVKAVKSPEEPYADRPDYIGNLPEPVEY